MIIVLFTVDFRQSTIRCSTTSTTINGTKTPNIFLQFLVAVTRISSPFLRFLIVLSLIDTFQNR